MSAFLNALSVTPLADGQQWRLNLPFEYESDIFFGGSIITVPAGFCTDFASIPKLFRNVLPSWNTYGPAAIIHDYLYTMQTSTRQGADEVLREAMHVLGVDAAIADAIFVAVRLNGQPSWDNNAELKASGYTRMASMNSNPPYAAI